MTPEKKVREKVREILKSHNIYFVSTTGVAAAGVPDILCCVNGGFVGLELKADKSKKPTELQTLNLSRIRYASGLSLLVHADNLAEFEEGMQTLMCGGREAFERLHPELIYSKELRHV